MEIKSIRLTSNNISYGPAPPKTDEVEQYITVSSSGRVWFSARNYEQYLAGKGFCRKKQFNIGKWKARFLVRLIGSIEEGDYVTDQGSWDLVVNYDDNKNKKVSGALIGNEGGSSYGGKHVSVTRIMRRYIPVYGLLGFDNSLSPDYEGKKAIFLFAEKWINFFSSEYIDNMNFELSFGDECAALGFQMDGGEEFLSRYPGCFDIHDSKLKAIVNEIYDVDLLGSAVFSYWRYLTHWAGPYQMDGDVRNWFLLILSRIRELTKRNRSDDGS